MFVNSEIPAEYKYLAELSDNYMVLVREKTLSSGIPYHAYIQFFNGSTQYLYLEDYYIKKGDNYVYNVNYSNNGVYSWIDDIESTFSLHTIDIGDNFSSSEVERFDFPNIFICQFLCLLAFVFILNQLSKIVVKDGVFR